MPSAKILCLHKISDVRYPSWPAMPLNTFEKLLKYVSRHYDVCLPQDLITQKSKKNRLILTFDDGYEDFYLYAWPLLNKYHLPAVLNVVAGCINGKLEIWTQRLNDTLDAYAKNDSLLYFELNGTHFKYHVNEDNAEMIALGIYRKLLPLNEQDRLKVLENIEKNTPAPVVKTPMLSSSQLAELTKNGVMIGSHSLSHINLKELSLTDEMLWNEIVLSKEKLQDITSENIDTFAFPNGMYNERSLKFARDGGYKYILLVNDKTASYNINDNPLLLDRILVYASKHWKNLIRIEKNRFSL